MENYTYKILVQKKYQNFLTNSATKIRDKNLDLNKSCISSQRILPLVLSQYSRNNQMIE